MIWATKMSPLFVLVFVLVFMLLVLNGDVEARSNVHIVYLGERQHDDIKLITDSHHAMLATVVGSKEMASDLMVYSYKHGFSGFAAKLTESHAKKLAELPEVVRVIPNNVHKLQTTRSWDFLGLSSHSPTNILHKSNMGDGVIIGVVDTGIWPESKSFNEKGLGPVPSRWKGVCKSGDKFNATTNCNRKIIGARWYVKGYLAENGPLNTTADQEYLSPRDANKHGTHTASTAGGSFVGNVSYKGLAPGTVRGGAPHARLAIYKACWTIQASCAAADVLKAFDDAIGDGVDVLSLSIGSSIPLLSDVDDLEVPGSFHAVARGITVVYAAGNGGPSAYTVTNTAPWILTVAASTMDRAFPTPITLGNNQTLLGEALFTGKEIGFTGLVYPTPTDLNSNSTSWLAGKVLLRFASLDDITIDDVKAAGGVGLITAMNPDDLSYLCAGDFPCIEVNYEVGTKILNYIRSTRSPLVKLSPSKTVVGKPVSPRVAAFSSRGPNSIAPAILKPDITAPGVNILAAGLDGVYFMDTGTSMATPHVSGIVALLKGLHPNWSPAAIKSALVTTAWQTHPSGLPIFAEGSSKKLADPFDFGGGIVNPNSAADPGLVYDMGAIDYIQYLCAMSYNNSAISRLTGKSTMCPTQKPSILDVNLPSITIPSLRNSSTITRTVTNVGPSKSIYRAVIKPPFGIMVSVEPPVLVFNSTVKKISFRVIISTTHKVNTGFYFGSLTWTNGVHAVTSPLSVKTDILQSYADEY